MTTLERYLKHERIYATVLVAGLVFINTTINATSILMEAKRSGASIVASHPFITEYSSALSILLLFPLILWLINRFPLRWGEMGRGLLAHLGFSVLFSLAHMALFVVQRKLLFGLQDLDYVFTDSILESGDCTVELKSGTTLSLSRRYRDALRQQFRISGT